MSKIHTHYDNLKVTRNAPSEVIRAAYKTLSQKYHPDRHDGHPDATRVMAIINGSYEVLSDPLRRQAHDEWIAAEEQELRSKRPEGFDRHPPEAPRPKASPGPTPQAKSSSAYSLAHRAGLAMAHLTRFWVLYFIGASVLFWLLAIQGNSSRPYVAPYSDTTGSTQSLPQQYKVPQEVVAPASRYQSIPPSAPSQPQYIRPTLAPNGQPWPTAAGYVRGYSQLNKDGLSTVTIDNTSNDSDVFVKLISDNGVNAYPVRQFYIPAGGQFKVNGVRAGNYDVRYRDLNSGKLSRSEPFFLREIIEADGTRYSNLTMTLYKVKNGNMKTFGLTEAEFER